MYRTISDIHNGIFDCMSRCTEACGEPTEGNHEARVKWHSEDEQTALIRDLWAIYNDAIEEAYAEGYVGVGCISYAEQAIREAQEP